MFCDIIIVLSYEAEAEELTTKDVINRLFEVIEIPNYYDSRNILERVKRIEIRTRGLVNDLFGGEYHSVFKGRGMTFSEVREYEPGDDIRLIDWNVTARAREPFVKIFEEERELTVYFLVDISRSGYFGSGKSLKQEIGAEIAAVLGFSAIKNNDKVGLILFSDQIEKYVPPKN